MERENLQKRDRVGRKVAAIGLVLTFTIILAPIGVPMLLAGLLVSQEAQQKLYGGGGFYHLVRPPEENEGVKS